MIVALVKNKYRGQKDNECVSAGSLHRLCAWSRWLAIAFATFALWRGREQRLRRCWPAPSRCSCWAWAAAPIGCWASPALALRAAQGLATRDINGLVPF